MMVKAWRWKVGFSKSRIAAAPFSESIWKHSPLTGDHSHEGFHNWLRQLYLLRTSFYDYHLQVIWIWRYSIFFCSWELSFNFRRITNQTVLLVLWLSLRIDHGLWFKPETRVLRDRGPSKTASPACWASGDGDTRNRDRKKSSGQALLFNI